MLTGYEQEIAELNKEIEELEWDLKFVDDVEEASDIKYQIELCKDKLWELQQALENCADAERQGL